MHPFTTDVAARDDESLNARELSCGGVLLELDRRRGLVAGIDLEFSPAEFAMVHLLFTRRGLPMSKQAISAGLPVQVDPRMVDVYVSRARTKLAEFGLESVIETVWGRGYRAGDPADAIPLEPPSSQNVEAAFVPA